MSPSTRSLPYVPLVPFPSSGIPVTGGDSLIENLNVYYESGDIAWMLMCTALSFLVIPGIGFSYSGLARKKSALSFLWLSIMGTAVVSFQWFLLGYSLAFSHNAGKFFGRLDNFGLKNVLAQPCVASPRIPDLLFCVYQCMIACQAVIVLTGAVAERGRLLPTLIFIFFWTTLIYNTIARWTLNPHGWIYKLGGLDAAGGTPVHIASGWAALAYSFALRPRKGYLKNDLNYPPHNITHVVLGTAFLWVGWLGLNAGSALGANMRAIMAAVVTHLAACCGGITWSLLDYCRGNRWSIMSFCSGVLAGLVIITPGSGYVPAWAAVIYGVVGGTICNYATKLKYFLCLDDPFDIVAIHAVGGFLGSILTALFAADYMAHLDGISNIEGGFVNHHWIQIGYQLAGSISGGLYSFVGSVIILCFLIYLGTHFPALKLRVPETREDLGVDKIELGELAYGHDQRLIQNSEQSRSGSYYDDTTRLLAS